MIVDFWAFENPYGRSILLFRSKKGVCGQILDLSDLRLTNSQLLQKKNNIFLAWALIIVFSHFLVSFFPFVFFCF